MKYLRAKFRNFRSFGNKIQTFEFNPNGGLNLLVGNNGSGKTNFRLAFEFLHHSRCTGKKGKKLPIKKLVNNININFQGELEFINDYNQNIHIKKTLNPTTIQLFLNNVDYTEKFKILDDSEKSKILGMNYETYKSFVSLSFDDFSDFINMSKDSKDNVLNKIFGYNKISKYVSVVDENLKYYSNQLNTTKKLLNECNSNLKEILEVDKDKNTLLLESYNSKLEDMKVNYNLYKTKIEDKNLAATDLKVVVNEIRIKISDFKTEINEIKNNIKIINSKKTDLYNEIELHKNGRCHLCKSDLTFNQDIEEDFNKALNIYVKEMNDSENKIKTLQTELEAVNIEYERNTNRLDKFEKEIDLFKSDMKVIKSKYTDINERIKEVEDSINNNSRYYSEMNKKIETYTNKITEFTQILNNNKTLKEILLSDDIKSKTINSVIQPLNNNINYYSKIFKINYFLKIDDNYNVIIKNNRDVLDENDISSGEERIANIIIALSYLNLLLEFKVLNTIFLDEIFVNIDLNTIDIILNVLKDLSVKYSINMFVVHHSELNQKYFDNTIRFYKKVFTDFKIN